MKETLGRRLQILRLERGWTLRDAEEAAGVDKSAISKIERGLARPHGLTLRKLAEAYGVPLRELLAHEDLVGAGPKADAPLGEAGTGRPKEEYREDPGIGAPIRRVYVEPIQETGQPEPTLAPEPVEHKLDPKEREGYIPEEEPLYPPHNLDDLKERIRSGSVIVGVVEEDGAWYPFDATVAERLGIADHVRGILERVHLREEQSFMLAFTPPKLRRAPGETEYIDENLSAILTAVMERRS